VLHRIGVLPVRFTRDHPELQVRAVRIVGYRFVCSCGEEGRTRNTYALARIDAAGHRAVTDVGEGIAPLEP
jgi:hypothetical protein